MSEASSQSWNAIRERVLDRDGYACRFCSMSEDEHQDKHDQGLHAHHVVPRSRGGEDTMNNLITVCTSCHRTIEKVHDTVVDEIKKQDKKQVIKSVDTLRVVFEQSQTVPSSIESRMEDYLNRNPTVNKNLQISVEREETPFLSNLDFMNHGPSKINSERKLFYQFGYHKAMIDLYNVLESVVDVEEMYEVAANE